MSYCRPSLARLVATVRQVGFLLPGNRKQRRFQSEFERFRALSARCRERLSLRWEDRYPCLNDRTAQTEYDRHYIYHPAWAARILQESKPPKHVDISSTLYFCAIVSAFVPVDFYDWRPADLRLSNLSSQKADLLGLPFPDASVVSLSCMHVVEHVGLGRYGDLLDPDGDLKAMKELQRVLAPGGSLLFVVPVGRPRIQFNAHRIYSGRQIVDSFPGLELLEFTLIPERSEDGGLNRGANLDETDQQAYGCGCFWFTKSRRAG